MTTAIWGNSLYTIVDGPSWTTADTNARNLGGYLVTINNSFENYWLVDTFEPLFEETTHNSIPGMKNAWIGFYEDTESGN